jgi:LPPG:FO 2-phospho-L-lactate transferase
MRVVLISGGVGGARLARGLAGIPEVDLTVITNVGDDAQIYGLKVSPDLDTVIYTLAGKEGPHGWGRAGDKFTVMKRLEPFPIDTTFAIGDLDMATNLFRTDRLAAGWTLSQVTTAIASSMGVRASILPVTDDSLLTEVKLSDGSWISFLEYFVIRGHRDEVIDVRFHGAESAAPGPGTIEAINRADALVIGPSNPPLSVWPVLAVKGIEEALAAKPKVIGVSPLIAGAALKGPAHRVLRSLGFPAGNAGVLAAYDGLITDFFVDVADAEDMGRLKGTRTHVADTRIENPEAATRLATMVLERA